MPKIDKIKKTKGILFPERIIETKNKQIKVKVNIYLV